MSNLWVQRGLAVLLLMLSGVSPAQVVMYEVPGRSAIVTLGDLNSDGVPDLAVSGVVDVVVRVISGADGGVLQTIHGAGTGFGTALAAPGDLTGDGLPDLVVGSPGSGLVQFIDLASGEVFDEVTGGALVLIGLGTSLAVLPDLDGDGVAELAAGAPGGLSPDSHGTVLLISGATRDMLGALRSPKLVLPGPDHFGYALARAGDHDGDGLDDLLVGQPGLFVFGGPGSVYVYGSGGLLAPGAVQPLRTYAGAVADFGKAVASPGDVDGDGTPDVLIGAPMGLEQPTNEGQAVLLSGADGSTIHVLDPSCPTYAFGTGVAAPGDLDLDGVPDLLVGGPGVFLFTELGRAQVYSGATGDTLYEFTGASSLLGGFGQMVADLGDLTGDGVHEFAIAGSPDEPLRVYSAQGVWTELGMALAGAAGEARMTGSGYLQGDDSFQIRVEQAPPSAPAVLFVGFGFGATPFLGGVMLPEWVATAEGLTTRPNGTLWLSGRWPPDAPSAAFYTQMWFVDPSGPQGASASNGLKAHAP